MPIIITSFESDKADSATGNATKFINDNHIDEILQMTTTSHTDSDGDSVFVVTIMYKY